MKTIIGLLLCLAIGFACRRFDIPLPAPNHWIGIAAVVSIYLGYLLGAK